MVQAECIVGKTQVYSRDKRLTQCIHTHSVLLTSYLFEGNRFPTTVLCAAGRDTVDHTVGKVDIFLSLLKCKKNLDFSRMLYP